MQVNRRLYRCYHDRKLAGVASGLAEYFDIDPTFVRILWIVSFLFGGLGLVLYIAMAIVVPQEPEQGFAPGGVAGQPDADATGQPAVPSPTGWHTTTPTAHRHVSRGNGRGITFVGIILILFGALALVEAVLPAWADSGRFLWPAFIVGIGALMVVIAVRREPTES
jgi:phage shock protein C